MSDGKQYVSWDKNDEKIAHIRFSKGINCNNVVPESELIELSREEMMMGYKICSDCQSFDQLGKSYLGDVEV